MARSPLFHRTCLALAALLCFVVVIGSYVPWSPVFPKRGHDPSWRWALNELHSKQAIFGSDLVHTYGPYGFTRNNDYHPSTYRTLLITRLALGVVFCLATLVLASQLLRPPLAVLMWLALFVPLAIRRDTFYMILPHIAWLLAVYGRGRVRMAMLVILMPALAMVSLSKSTFGLMTLVIVSLIGVHGVLSPSRPTSTRPAMGPGSDAAARAAWKSAGWPVWYLIWLVVFWLAAGQSLGQISTYIESRLHTMAAYTASHAVEGPLWQVFAFGAAAAVLLAVVTITESRRDRKRGVLTALALAALLFLTSKLAFTRHDFHALNAGFTGVSAALLYGLVVAREGPYRDLSPQWRRARWVMVATVVGAFWLQGSAIARSMNRLDLAAYYFRTPERVIEQLRGAAGLLENSDGYSTLYEEAKARLRDLYPLPEIDGTVDSYTSDLSALFAHDLSYDPRPTLQSLLAGNPWLAQRNANHVEWPRGPDHILCDIKPTDRHFPLMEDGPTWPPLLSGYLPRSWSRPPLVLDRAAEPGALRWGTWESYDLQLGQWKQVELVSAALSWASLDIDRTIPGQLISFVFKGPRVVIDLQLADGSQARYRIVPGMARAGFILSPLIESTSELSLLWTRGWPDTLAAKQVRSIRIRTVPEAPSIYRSRISMRLRTLDIVVPQKMESMP